MRACRAIRPRGIWPASRVAGALFSFFLLFTGPLRADIPVDTESLQLRFSDYGDLVSARACLPTCGAPGAHEQEFTSYRGFISLNRDSGVVFEFERLNGDGSVQLVFTNLFTNEVRRWRIPHKGYGFGLEVSRHQDLSMASGESFLPREMAGFGGWLESLRYVTLSRGEIRQTGLGEETGGLTDATGWLGYRNRYWAAMIRSEGPAVRAAMRTGKDQAEAQVDISAAHAGAMRYTVYAGPVETSALERAHPELSKLMYSGLWSWLAWISAAFAWMLSAIHSFLPNWGLSIIVLSVLVQLLMRPLNRWAERLQDGVRDTETRLAPKLREIKSTLKGAEQAERIMQLYRDEGVHPLYSLKGMAGVLVIIPVFIGAFNMLAENIWLAGQSFGWIEDLSLTDAFAALPFEVPFLGSELNLLPFLMVALSVPASTLRASNEADPGLRARQARNLVLMSLAFFLLFYTFPAGMVLYWVVNNAGSLLTSLLHRFRTRAEDS